jgi:hypothetical protein
MINGRQYAVVTAAYWAFTLTDGALRLLVLLHFHKLGYSPIQLAFLFLLYEFFGIVTNLVGGWLAARTGVRFTLAGGLALQVIALGALAFLNPAWSQAVSVAFVTGCQALSGIAKDLTKMSAKSAVKSLVAAGDESGLFKWVAVLTGSKNALKGAGFFLGALLLSTLGFRGGLLAMAGGVALVLAGVMLFLSGSIGRPKVKAGFASVFSNSPGINRLSIARFALFASRDVWFVVAVPVFLTEVLGWTFLETGAFMALWVIGYGIVQGLTPSLLAKTVGSAAVGPGLTSSLGFLLAGATAAIPLALQAGLSPAVSMLAGLAAFGFVFALNSSLHSYLVLAYSDVDRAAMNVGFYYMANAGGRLLGTLLSGLLYQAAGVTGALWGAAGLALLAALTAIWLPPVGGTVSWAHAKGDE